MTFHIHILLYICDFILLNVFPFTMNASSWKKAANLVAKVTPANPQLQAAAMADSQQLESLPLSALSMDDSGPPQVTYDSQQPIATSTPRAALTVTSETPTEAYRQIKEFLKHFPRESREKAFEQIYKVLQTLDAYLIDNPQQHLYCMSPDSEYVSLIMYAITIEIDLCNFPAIWAVLSIFLDTQSNELQHVKNLQQVVDDYYDKCPTEVMSRLEHQITDIMNTMYDSVNNDNFYSISDYTYRVSGVVDNDYDRDDKDKDDMP